MDFVSARELRAESAKVWAKVEAGEDVVITRNGKPFAVLVNTSPEGLNPACCSWGTLRGDGAQAARKRGAARVG